MSLLYSCATAKFSCFSLAREARVSGRRRRESFHEDNRVSKIARIAKKAFQHYRVDREGFSSFFSTYYKQARWVYESIDASHVSGPYKRPKKRKFKPDPMLPIEFQAKDADYKRSGLSRGHLGCCANHKDSIEAMKETFYFSNVSPQDTELNAGIMNTSEIFARRLTSIFKRVHILTGPLFMQESPLSSLREGIRYIGGNHIPVPTHFFKVLFLEGGDGRISRIKAFLMPNAPPTSIKLSDYEVSALSIEEASALDFASIISVKGVGELMLKEELAKGAYVSSISIEERKAIMAA